LALDLLTSTQLALPPLLFEQNVDDAPRHKPDEGDNDKHDD